MKETGNTQTGMIVTYNQNIASALVGFDSYDPSFLMALPFATLVRIMEMISDAALPGDKKDEACYDGKFWIGFSKYLILKLLYYFAVNYYIV